MATNGAHATPSSMIPIVDFADFTTSTSAATRQRIADELVRASREVGFVYRTALLGGVPPCEPAATLTNLDSIFYISAYHLLATNTSLVINHSVPPTLLSHAFNTSRHFFSLPLSSKMLAPHPPGWAIHRGYSWPGLEKVSNATSSTSLDSDAELIKQMREVQDFKESYEVGSENDPDMPNVWLPEGLYDEFRPFMLSFYETCFTAAKDVLRALALGLGLREEDELLKMHSGNYNQLRLLHYPSLPAELLEEGKVERMPSHSDWSTITLLFQDQVGGLQVERPGRGGEFVDVEPVEGGMLVNVGDLLMRMSGGYLRSTAHRVGLPRGLRRQGVEGGGDTDGTGDRVTQERFSIAYFLTTDPETVIGGLEAKGVDGKVREGLETYEPITRREYYAMRASMQY